ncbi:MAG TPA: HAD family hydrolase [Candidatus Binataceae bacterium]|nr:HAD family hydrolase [Candidatus Binataceae bacterium]
MSAWLFDFDNTLVALESAVDWAASRIELEQYLRREGVGDAIFAEIPRGNLPLYEALRARLMDGAGEAAEREALGSLARKDTEALLRSASAIIEAYELRGIERAQTLPGATALLRALKARNNAVAIVTSNSARTIERWLALQHPRLHLDAIVGRDAMLPLKPAPDSIGRALELCRTAPDDAFFVGDSEADAGAAGAARVRFYGIAARPLQRTRLIGVGALAVFDSPAELKNSLIFTGAT